MSDFPARLRALRTEAGLSVAELAAKAEMSRETIRLYENGARAPTWAQVQKLVDALGVSTEQFRDPTS